MYELAAVQMLIPPSRVISRDAPYLPPCEDIFAFYHVPLEKAEALDRNLTKAVALYSKLTGGGGAGTDLLFRAGLKLRQGYSDEAACLVKQALSVGSDWLKRPAKYLLGQLNKTKVIV